jgi:hypothetical protein
LIQGSCTINIKIPPTYKFSLIPTPPVTVKAPVVVDVEPVPLVIPISSA